MIYLFPFYYSHSGSLLPDVNVNATLINYSITVVVVLVLS